MRGSKSSGVYRRRIAGDIRRVYQPRLMVVANRTTVGAVRDNGVSFRKHDSLADGPANCEIHSTILFTCGQTISCRIEALQDDIFRGCRTRRSSLTESQPPVLRCFWLFGPIKFSVPIKTVGFLFYLRNRPLRSSTISIMRMIPSIPIPP